MAGPYNPPNPYGSYFTFDHPGAVGQASFMPSATGNLSPGAMSMMGMGSGGFNPTPLEFMNTRIHNFYQQQFMASMLRNDPRAITLTNALLQQMYGNNIAARNRGLANIGGQGNLTEMVGTALSFPGINGLTGGSQLALGQGAYALAASGLNVNNRLMTGDGPIQLMAAGQIADMVTKRFYMSNGTPNMAMTQGLSRDQLGGMMMMMAREGTFSGMNLLNTTRGGAKMDEGTLNKIAEVTKSAAKAISSLIDIYGDASISELANKAQAITGLSFNRAGNVGQIASRLDSLRQAASYTGVDIQSMMDLSAGAVAAGQRYGLGGNMLGAIGTSTAIRANQIFGSRRSNLGVFEMAAPDPHVIANDLMRDQGAMMRDPIGVRRAALTVAIEEGHLGGSAAAEARALMIEGGPETGRRMDALMARQGISMQNYIAGAGGPAGLMQGMSLAGASALSGYNQEDVRRRARQTIGRDVRRTFRDISGDAAAAMFDLVDNLRNDTLKNAFASSNASELETAIKADPMGNTNPRKFMDLIGRARDYRGDAFGVIQFISKSMAQGPWGNIEKKADEISRVANEVAQRSFVEGDRGGLIAGGATFAGFLNRISGKDPKTAMVQAMIMQRGQFAGLREGLIVGADASIEDMRQNVDILRNDFRKLPGGFEMLKELGVAGNTPASQIDVNVLRRMRSILSTDVESDRFFYQHGLRTFKIGGRLAAQTLKSMEIAKQWGNEASVAYALGKSFHEQGDVTSARAFYNISTAFNTSEDTNRKREMIALTSQFRAHAVDAFRNMGEDQFTQMVGVSTSFRDIMGEIAEKGLKTTDPKALKDFQAMYRIAQGAGYTGPPTSGAITTLNGKLEWAGGGEFRINGKLVAPAAK